MTTTFWDSAPIEECLVAPITSNNLLELANYYQTDKGDSYGAAHNYAPLYQSLLSPMRKNRLKVLEIGVARGSSLKMWASWLTNSTIYGIDINPGCAELCQAFENIHVIVGDAGQHSFGQTKFDIIIDDGSHLAGDIIQAWDNLRGNVHSNTIYIIEDIHSTFDRPYLLEFRKTRDPGMPEENWLSQNDAVRLAEFLQRNSEEMDVTVYQDKVAVIRHPLMVVDRGDAVSFSFGENWLDFHRTLDTSAVDSAIADIKDWVSPSDLAGKAVLDIGSGSGLSSLAFQRCGVGRIVSIDVDPSSVEATRQISAKHGEKTPWDVKPGSVLDQAFVSSLGRFDVVYSWGVLHHTGALWKAIENAMSCCKDGGLFWIAIYSGGPKYRSDLTLKQQYNAASQDEKAAMIEREIKAYQSELSLAGKDESEWNHRKERGMNIRNDIVDWLGGLPYEVARVSEMLLFCSERKFVPLRVLEFPEGGCSIYLFRRQLRANDNSEAKKFLYRHVQSQFSVYRTLMQQVRIDFATADERLSNMESDLRQQLCWLDRVVELEGKVNSGSFLMKSVTEWLKRKMRS
jgi:2-polyprenyl-3-methyl-5-hydroxy-6-metoxy-1,4-benzoquinol methylase